MTSSEVPSRIAIKRPFAESGERSTIGDASGNLNYPQGFSSVYSNPVSNGGQYLKRGDLNVIGNIATNDLFYHKCGGLNTFDPAFSAKIGGYPKDAVLQFRNGTYIYDVISLVDNNTFDFTENSVIDNINWAYCNKDATPVGQTLVYNSSGPFAPQGQYFYECTTGTIFGYFTPAKTAPLIASSDAQGSFIYQNTSGHAGTYIGGFAVLVKDIGTDVSEYANIDPPAIDTFESNGWKVAFTYQFKSLAYSSGGSHTDRMIPQQTILASYGKIYAVAYMYGAVVTAAGSSFAVSEVNIFT